MILGLSFSHNATACLVDADSGEIVFCCSEERFSRRKNDWGVPRRVLRHIVDHVVPARAITAVAVGELCQARYGSEAFANLLYLSDHEEKDRNIRARARFLGGVAWDVVCRSVGERSDYRQLVSDQLGSMGITPRPVFVDHHEAHAASALYCSPFQEALAVTLDGEGDGASGSCWLGSEGSRLDPICVLDETQSIGKFYRSVTALLGFRVNRHEGKVTGLAAYGDPQRFLTEFRELLSCAAEAEECQVVSRMAQWHLQTFALRKVRPLRLLKFIGEFVAARTWEDMLNAMVQRQFRELYARVLDLRLDRLTFQDMADVAAAAQCVVEEVVVEFVGFYQQRTRAQNCVFAGGVFANVKLNQRLLERLQLDNIYVHPGMGDEGLAVGAALRHLHRGRSGRAAMAAPRDVYLGPSYGAETVRAALGEHAVRAERVSPEVLIESVVEALLKDEIVGLFRGRSEYGPRALGHRSILVSPTRAKINQTVNHRLRRTEFMPFAPVVLEEHFDDVFTGPKLQGARQAARFMTITLEVKASWRSRIAGVVHVDGTARPQIVGAEDDPVYYGIVRRFHERTGIPCLVNTSFNVHEEPIVNTPADALRSLMAGAVDLLAMEDHLVRCGAGTPTE